MRVLITGATGLVGSEIVRFCHERNIDVNYLTTRSKKIVSQKNYQGFLWKPDRGEINLECFKGVTAIINLAGSTISKRWTPRNRKRIIKSRVNTLRTLREGLEKIDSSRIVSLVSASAIGIYPHSFDSYYVENEKGVDDSFLGQVVQAWEKEVDAFKKFDLKISKIRIGLVMSLKGGALPEMAKPINNYVGAAIGNGEQWQSWIHISDLARIFLFVIDNELRGVYNGVGPNPVSNAKLVKEIAKVLDKPLLLPNIPKLVLRILLGKMAYLLFASQRVSSKKIEEEGFVFEYQNICRALDQIYRTKTDKELSNSLSIKEYVQ